MTIEEEYWAGAQTLLNFSSNNFPHKRPKCAASCREKKAILSQNDSINESTNLKGYNLANFIDLTQKTTAALITDGTVNTCHCYRCHASQESNHSHMMLYKCYNLVNFIDLRQTTTAALITDGTVNTFENRRGPVELALIRFLLVASYLYVQSPYMPEQSSETDMVPVCQTHFLMWTWAIESLFANKKTALRMTLNDARRHLVSLVDIITEENWQRITTETVAEVTNLDHTIFQILENIKKHHVETNSSTKRKRPSILRSHFLSKHVQDEINRGFRSPFKDLGFSTCVDNQIKGMLMERLKGFARGDSTDNMTCQTASARDNDLKTL